MNLGLALVISVAAISVFTFLAIVVRSGNRTKEQTERLRSETLRKIAEQNGEGAEKVLALIREEDRIAWRRRVEGLKLGGLIVTVTALGLGLFLYEVAPVVAPLAAIPLLIGLALLIHVFLIAQKPEAVA